MKDIIIYIVIILGISFASCSRTEDNLFDKSAAIRVNEEITDVSTLLQSADNGWIMEYFPNNESAGATFLVKFTSPKEVTMSTLNNYIPTYKEATGYWQVLNDMGPVITFDTYNDVFHIFSDPVTPGTSEADGIGLGGDYEFLVAKKSNDTITLKGKKHGAITLLRKLKFEQSGRNFFSLLGQIDSTMFGESDIKLRLIQNGSEVMTLSNGKTHIFTVVKKGANEIDDATTQPFIVTESGIRFATPFMVNDQKVQTFKLSDDKKQLTSTESGVAINIIPPVINSYLLSSMSLWKTDTLNMSEDFRSHIRALATAMKKVYPSRSFEYFGITRNTTYLNSLIFRVTNADAIYKINFSVASEDIVNLSGTTETSNWANNNGKTFWNKTDEISKTLSFFYGQYKVSTNKPMVMNRVKYERVDNPNSYFTVYR